MGPETLYNNTIGSNNTAIGTNALRGCSGNFNCALGSLAGYNCTSGSNNIYIYDQGAADDSNVVKIGTTGIHTTCFIQGIYNATLSSPGSQVFVDDIGQLGTSPPPSSKKYKDNIQDIGDLSYNIRNLRPVMYNYKSRPDTMRYGFIAEEVAEHYPELVIYKNSEPDSIRYDVIPILVINELQKSLKHNEILERNMTELQNSHDILQKQIIKEREDMITECQKHTVPLQEQINELRNVNNALQEQIIQLNKCYQLLIQRLG